jgi:hypothetical protein
VEAEKQSSIQQSSNDLTVIPYVPIDGIWTMTDDLVASVFDLLVDQGLVDTVFRDGTMQSQEQFLKFCKNPQRVLCFIADEKECVGLAWLMPVSDHHAFAHFCFLKNIWGSRTSEVANLILDYWFSFGGDDPLLDVIIGVIPADNRMANNFLRRINWTTLGEIPHMFRDPFGVKSDALIHYVTREQHGQK